MQQTFVQHAGNMMPGTLKDSVRALPGSARALQSTMCRLQEASQRSQLWKLNPEEARKHSKASCYTSFQGPRLNRKCLMALGFARWRCFRLGCTRYLQRTNTHGLHMIANLVMAMLLSPCSLLGPVLPPKRQTHKLPEGRQSQTGLFFDLHVNLGQWLFLKDLTRLGWVPQDYNLHQAPP